MEQLKRLQVTCSQHRHLGKQGQAWEDRTGADATFTHHLTDHRLPPGLSGGRTEEPEQQCWEQGECQRRPERSSLKPSKPAGRQGWA